MRSELSATKIARLWPYHERAIRSCRNQIELADGGFTVSSILRDQISKWNPKAKKFSVIQNGYEDDLFNLKNEPLGIKEKLGLSGKMVVFVGALGPWHGTDELAEIAKVNPNISVVVAGGGYGHNLPKLRNLHHIGRLERHEVPGLLVEADIGLAPYPNVDYGFSPLKIYEYMGCNLPVVATLLPSVEEATQGHALLVRPGQMADAISKIINNEKLLSDLSVSAFKYASRERTWSKTIEKTIELYKGLL
jgi:glycosyltransferase involved in cell wall biosynthesis